MLLTSTYRADQPVKVIISAGFYGRPDLVYGLQDIDEVTKNKKR